ncbi:MAG: hypothetical protein H6972_16105 [Gammaproteobacteria bacterium]|nr:hypothetical protein [Gammaproteobacteria bacterium]
MLNRRSSTFHHTPPLIYATKPYCFDATINGQSVIPLRSRDTLARYRDVSHYASDTAWQLLEPISGEIEIHAATNEQGRDWIGPRANVEIGVVPLGGQNLASTPKLSQREDGVDPTVVSPAAI